MHDSPMTGAGSRQEVEKDLLLTDPGTRRIDNRENRRESRHLPGPSQIQRPQRNVQLALHLFAVP